jgi:hypothetical protein
MREFTDSEEFIMPIAFSKYINITSGVSAGNVVPVPQLLGRMISTNPLIPTGTILSFSDLDDVGTYFGTTSTEYLRARFYFGFISKSLQKAQGLSFSRWTNANTAPQIFGAPLAGIPTTLTNLQAITAGNFVLSLGGVTNTIGPLNFSSAGTLSAVATDIQTAIRTNTGTQWTGATVTYDSTRGSFDFVGGDNTVNATITVTAAGSNDISSIIGWNNTGTILSNGLQTETITQTLSNSTTINNNFGSFLFIPTLDLAQVTEAAAWNITQNNFYQYCVPVSVANASSWSAALITYAGLGMTLAPLSNEYPEQAPMMILAATNYNLAGATQNYMFQMFSGLTPSVTTTADSNTYDALSINYYGSTQEAGIPISFYQRGVLMGTDTSPLDMNTYANEQWLKRQIGATLLNLLLTVTQVPANTQGIAMVTAVIHAALILALLNGTISVGKTLTDAQKAQIDILTGIQNSWRAVQNQGYYLVVSTEFISPNWQINYLLVYSKEDDIRFINGIHSLI